MLLFAILLPSGLILFAILEHIGARKLINIVSELTPFIHLQIGEVMAGILLKSRRWRRLLLTLRSKGRVPELGL